MLSQKSFTMIFPVVLLFQTVQAGTPSPSGPQCSGEIAVASMACINPDGGDDDVRLYVMEIQECKDGKIVGLSKSIIGEVFSEPIGDERTTTEVTFSGIRTLFHDRVNHLTMELPKSAVIKTPLSTTVNMQITNEIGADYEGADIESSWHYKGNFELIDKSGAVRNGRIACSISR